MNTTIVVNWAEWNKAAIVKFQLSRGNLVIGIPAIIKIYHVHLKPVGKGEENPLPRTCNSDNSVKCRLVTKQLLTSCRAYPRRIWSIHSTGRLSLNTIVCSWRRCSDGRRRGEINEAPWGLINVQSGKQVGINYIPSTSVALSKGWSHKD